MRLQKLMVHGFKSFADRTEFVFDSPITGIVGPNGCGKSNVVDAFKWVLGEQSAKSLRGDAMMDVIFNGSGTRKPGNMAEVTLVFENPKRIDDTRHLNLDFDEVAVGRRLYRDGGSEYHLNGKITRLKDVRELFMDTGIGVDAYSVIEQGRVSALLDANPAERRQIFEEAAGISKYKVKKKEAQRKLEKVDQNLLRVSDIVEEVDKRLRSVKLQAGKARTYQEHSTRLDELRLSHSLHEYHTQHHKLRETRRELEDAQFRLDDLAGDLAKAQTELTSRREQADALQRQKQQAEYDAVQTKAQLQTAEQKQHYAGQQLQQMADQVESFDRDHEQLQTRLAETEAALIERSATLATLTAELSEHRKAIEQRQAAFHDGQLKLNQLNREVEQNKSSVLDLMRKSAQLNNRSGAIDIERKNIGAQQDRLTARKQVIGDELSALTGRREELDAKMNEALAVIADRQAEFDAAKTESATVGKQNAVASQNLGAAREHRSGLQSRQKLLTDLEARREGVSEGVKSVLKQRDGVFSFIRGLVADVMRVDVEHAHVIEAALDGRDQWLVATRQAKAVDVETALADLEGRVNVLCFDRLDPGVSYVAWDEWPRRVRLAADLVRVEPQDIRVRDYLLGRTAIVDDLRTAQALHLKGPRGWRFVTHAGEVLETDGTLRAGPLSAAMGLLSRRSELDAVNQQITETEGRIESLSQSLTQGNAAAKALDEKQNALRSAVYQANTAKVELASAIATNNDKQNGAMREQPLLDRELGAYIQQLEKLAEESNKLTDQKTAIDTEQTDRQSKVESLQASHAQQSEELKETAEALTAARVQLGQVQEKQLSVQADVSRQTASVAESKQQIARVIASAKAIVDKRAAVEHDLATAKHAEVTLQQNQQSLAEQIVSLTDRLREAAAAVAAVGATVETSRKSHGEVEQEFHQLQLQSSELAVRLESLISRTMDEMQFDLPAKYEAIEGGYQPQELDWPAIAIEIKELREKIARLGSVNVDAIAEQDDLQTRQTFLATQLTDLADSKRQLEELIDTINIESGLRFEQTFTAVREHFQTLFRKLFGGGKADVVLVTEVEVKSDIPGGEPTMKMVDVLDAGIEIIARPPGKQPATISQLSGGEKTMTCIALLMSIFKSKPSPFCILDEVDAALDEANNQRFNQIVQEFVEQSQFIVITHSKRTMQIAEQLYGVTMQEQGVSKRVAVKFDQVGSDGRLAETVAA